MIIIATLESCFVNGQKIKMGDLDRNLNIDPLINVFLSYVNDVVVLDNDVIKGENETMNLRI